MRKTILFAALLSMTGISHAICVTDAPEIGDVGPASEYVCDMLDAWIPQANIAILDRTPLSPDSVSILVSLNGHQKFLKYVLSGPRWVLSEEALIGKKDGWP